MSLSRVHRVKARVCRAPEAKSIGGPAQINRRVKVITCYAKMEGPNRKNPARLGDIERLDPQIAKNLEHMAEHGVAITEALLRWIRDTHVREVFLQDLSNLNFRTAPEEAVNVMTRISQTRGWEAQREGKYGYMRISEHFELSRCENFQGKDAEKNIRELPKANQTVVRKILQELGDNWAVLDILAYPDF